MAVDTVPRIVELQELRKRVDSSDVNDDTVFHELFRECLRMFELTDQEAANALMVTRTTVNRWVRGQNLPHRALRKHLRIWMEEQLSRKIRFLDTGSRSAGTRNP